MQIFSDKKKKRVIENRVMENRVKRGITVGLYTVWEIWIFKYKISYYGGGLYLEISIL